VTGLEVDVYDGDSLPEGAFAVRDRVFVDEQDVPKDLEYDGRDADAVHALARDGDEAIGTGRLRTVDGSTAKIERLAVLPRHRGRGIGRQLVETLEATARDRGLERIVLHAQVTAEGFYQSLGYETVSDVFQEAGMDHVEMEKRLLA